MMDQSSIPPGELAQTLRELDVVNRWLGGYMVSLEGLDRLHDKSSTPLQILDVGSGGGDFLARAQAWGEQQGIRVAGLGIDLLQDAVSIADARYGSLEGLRFDCQDLLEMEGENRFDVVHASLTLHHFHHERAGEALRRMLALSRVGVVINDLHRHPLAYYGINLMTALFSKSRLIRNDALFSVLNGFSRRDLEELMQALPCQKYELHWRWTFRWLLVIYK